MHSKKVYLIINPRGGQDLTRFSDMMAVFAAAGWKVDTALVEYGGQEETLAQEAISEGYELLIAHGGDGTMNKVVEAVALANQGKGGKASKSSTPAVGALSGGTANQWVHEIGYPTDPVQAALALINSDVRHVDIGRISVECVTFPAAQHQKQKAHKKIHMKNARYFLLTAGFGIDAAIISHTSKTLKDRVGMLAYDVAAIKELPEQHPFYAEIHPIEDIARETKTKDTAESQASQASIGQSELGKQEPSGQAWKGQVIQIVVGNTRRYGDAVELNPNAFIDDGLLDICIMNNDGTVKSVQQLASLLFQKKSDNSSTTSLHNSNFTITLPAHVALQLDGGAVELRHFLSATEQDALEHQSDPSQVLVTYRIDVLPGAVATTVPRTYDNTLFSQPKHTSPASIEENSALPGKLLTEQPLSPGQLDALTHDSQRVTVVGIAPDPAHPRTYIIAGTMPKLLTGDFVPVAVFINKETHIYKSSGEPCLPETTQELQINSAVLVAGKPNKRGVIQATHIIL